MLIRVAFRLALALLLALTSAHVAVTRVMSGPVAWVDICAGTVAKPVAIDAEGNPVKPHPTCPDCVIAAGILPAGTVITAPTVQMATLHAVAASAQWRAPLRRFGLARGPPLVV